MDSCKLQAEYVEKEAQFHFTLQPLQSCQYI